MRRPKSQPAIRYVTCHCKICGGGIEFPDEGLGQEITCPHCGKVIRLQPQSSRLRFITAVIVVSVVIGAVTTALIVTSEHAGNQSKAGSVQNAQAGLIAKAEGGDAAAQFELGLRYENGDWGARNAVESAKWFRKAAEQGNPEAEYYVGLIYYVGETTPQNFPEAFKWFQKAAEQGHAASEFELGEMYDYANGVNQDYIQASVWYQKAAEKGNADAQLHLGFLFFNGDGVTQDAQATSEWFTKAAKQGNKYAQFYLGLMYDPLGKMFFNKAHNEVAAAHPGPQTSMEYLFSATPTGAAFPKDDAEAFKWYNLAAAAGLKIALTNRNELEVFMTREQVADGQQRTRSFALSHPVGFAQEPTFKNVKVRAENGDSDAQFQIGMYYAQGDTAPLDYVEAYKWFSLSAAQGQQTAERARDIVLKEMTPKAVAEGQSQAADKPKK
jgi:TPR repeat protein